MSNIPTATELLEAVADFLRDTAAPRLQDQAAFHAIVAANVIDIVRRELSAQPSADAAEQARLQALLGHQDGLSPLRRTLCAAIRNKQFALDAPELLGHLWQTAAAQLAIDQPSYATYRAQFTNANEADLA